MEPIRIVFDIGFPISSIEIWGSLIAVLIILAFLNMGVAVSPADEKIYLRNAKNSVSNRGAKLIVILRGHIKSQ
jgi:hypothetical protein